MVSNIIIFKIYIVRKIILTLLFTNIYTLVVLFIVYLFRNRLNGSN